MSRLSKKPIPIPEGVTVKLKDGVLNFKGPKGELNLKVLSYTSAKIDEKSISVKLQKDFKQGRANVGTMHSLIRNCLEGVSNGFSKTLEIEGVGYRTAMEDKTLVLNIGFSNPVKYDPPQGVSITTDKNTITISGIDKQKVGEAAAEIRAKKKPEPYRGKGIRYQGEVIRRKAGKKAVTTT